MERPVLGRELRNTGLINRVNTSRKRRRNTHPLNMPKHVSSFSQGTILKTIISF
jgi:hypothetical protein